MLGAGFVTRPTLDILSDAGIEVSVGTESVTKFPNWASLMILSLQNPRQREETLRRSEECEPYIPRRHRRQSS